MNERGIKAFAELLRLPRKPSPDFWFILHSLQSNSTHTLKEEASPYGKWRDTQGKAEGWESWVIILQGKTAQKQKIQLQQKRHRYSTLSVPFLFLVPQFFVPSYFVRSRQQYDFIWVPEVTDNQKNMWPNRKELTNNRLPQQTPSTEGSSINITQSGNARLCCNQAGFRILHLTRWYPN